MAFVAVQPVIRSMDESDPEMLSAAFTAIGGRSRPHCFSAISQSKSAVRGSPLSLNGEVTLLAM